MPRDAISFVANAPLRTLIVSNGAFATGRARRPAAIAHDEQLRASLSDREIAPCGYSPG
ncbi:hypothetical protein [Amycolatopsis sp. NPDC059021]|uniref:hypothetical protein n=1 Tax=Amycolatopsis sp. NPDC059021 TaxID=3346704 RepID=UPI00366FA5DF